MDVTVVGLGYVGAVAAAALSAMGCNVLGVDRSHERVASFSQGLCPFYEPGLPEQISSGLASGRLVFRHLTEAKQRLGHVVLVAVGTPTEPYGGTDLSQVKTAIRWIRETAPASSIVIMKSTVPPGTGLRLIAEELPSSQAQYVFNPEFLREGQAVHDWFHPDRIVIGGQDEGAIKLARELYQDIDAPVLVTDITSAEMIKYAANAFLPTKISFINEVACLCDHIGANIDDVARGVGLDTRIGASFLNAGLGYGGSCFPKDTRALEFLSTVKGFNCELLHAVININNRQRLLPIQELQKQFGTLKGLRTAVLGLAFKPDTDDVREAPALDIIRVLVELGAKVQAYDPRAMGTARAQLPQEVDFRDSALGALEDAQAVIVTTEWREFRELQWNHVFELMLAPRLVFDGRNTLDGRALQKMGFRYRGVGRSGPAWSADE